LKAPKSNQKVLVQN